MFKIFKFNSPKKKKVSMETNLDTENISKSKTKKFNPAVLFANNMIAARFWMFTCCVMLAGLIVQPILMTYFATKNKESVVIMDPSGEFHLDPVIGMDKAMEMHEYIAELATMAFLDRNPNGLDNKELLNQTFTNSAIEKIKLQLSKESERFAKRLIHQKAELKSIKAVRTSDNKVICQVKGQLIRNGEYKGQAFQEGMDFVLNLLMLKNPDFGNNLRLPLAVAKYSLSTTPMNNNKV
ncbi:MAG: hypothetical protein K9L78_04395 [Victivallales bacterium]|nr:hypothetical protein [Victivallales bacterium]